ncbi:hypothetical protein I4U23_010921 [Adineta vaga]|nr:hypothetical protein I4U23_010921 [Adineta vaga]
MISQSLMKKNQNEWQELSIIALGTPWLFPKSNTLFPYLGMHNDLDALLQIVTKQSKKVTMLGFTWHWQAMLQNNIFTLVRFARATNYIVVAFDEVTLLVCIELNLPCYNGSSYVPNYQKNTFLPREGTYGQPYWEAIGWYWVPLCLDILRKRYTIIKSDADISFAPKNIWKAYELMSEKTGADLIFMRELPINTGHLYAIPNDRVISCFEEWIASRSWFKLTEQMTLMRLHNKTYMVCDSKVSCNRVKMVSMVHVAGHPFHAKNQHSKMAAVTTYRSPYARFRQICPPDQIISPCDADVLYVHAICAPGTISKIRKLKQLGFWLMSDQCTTSEFDLSFRSPKFVNVSLTRCVPLPLVQPTTETYYLRCNSSEYVAPLSLAV